ncbi:glycosylphosphatidylinositol anchor attachment 1 protein isoform X2 [Iris pallida]|nr:glycosylphosphatidylinositol anchor attachment 1 protein isoform X2 [Iris pallida]KAJ6815308.1 glycosylphosphatidylinositol anchor attachment 1 protein isoform X2 [Iris pallida]
MIAFALLIAPLPIVAAALFSDSKRKESSMDASEKSEEVEREADSWKWLHAAKVVFMVHLWTVVVSLLPYKISQFSGITTTTSMLLWVGFSVASLLILYRVMGSPYSYSSKNGEWKILKAVTVAAASIGLGLMSIINFSTAQIGAMLLVPMCLMVRPLRRHAVAAFSLRILVHHACNLALVLVGFPPAGSIIVKAFSEGFERASIGTFWEWAEFLWAWNSATYLYLLLVHLPCWVLCVLILCHP